MTGEELISRLDWPKDVTVETLAPAIARPSGFDEIVVRPMPDAASERGLSGLTIPDGRIANVYYDPSMTLLNRSQTILHEYAHILHGDVIADDYEVVHRTAFADPRERTAETTGMKLLFEIQTRQRRSRGGVNMSAVLEFMSGKLGGSAS